MGINISSIQPGEEFLCRELVEYFLQNRKRVFVENLPTIQVYEKAGFKKREYKMQLKLDKTKKYTPFF